MFLIVFFWLSLNNFLLIESTDRISSDNYRIQFDISLYPLSFYANTSFKKYEKCIKLSFLSLHAKYERNHATQVIFPVSLKKLGLYSLENKKLRAI